MLALKTRIFLFVQLWNNSIELTNLWQAALWNIIIATGWVDMKATWGSTLKKLLFIGQNSQNYDCFGKCVNFSSLADLKATGGSLTVDHQFKLWDNFIELTHVWQQCALALWCHTKLTKKTIWSGKDIAELTLQYNLRNFRKMKFLILKYSNIQVQRKKCCPNIPFYRKEYSM